MAAIDFPASPTLNQVFASTNGVNYQWNGTMWLAVGPTSPTTPGGDFYATKSATDVGMTTTPATLIFGTVVSGNSGGWYSTSTGRFTPPAGRYTLFASSMFYAGAGPIICYLTLRKNGTTIGITQAQTTSTAPAPGSVVNSAIVDANGTDWFDVQAAGSMAGATNGGNFSAFPISGIKGPPGEPGTQVVPFNRLHNAGLLVCDKGIGPFGTGLTTYNYGFNRWAVGAATVAGSFTRVEAAKGFGVTITGAAGNTNMAWAQGLEAGDCNDLINQPMCLSVVASSVGKTVMSWKVSYCNTSNDHLNRTQIATGTFPMTTTPTLQTATFNAGANARSGLVIEFFTNAALGAAQTWTLSQPQLVTGSTPITFWLKPTAEETLSCMRYYQYRDNIHFGFLSAAGGAWRHSEAFKPVLFRPPNVYYTGQTPTTHLYSDPTGFSAEWSTGSTDVRFTFSYTADAEPPL